MPKKRPAFLDLQSQDGRNRKFFYLHSYKPNERLLGIFGFDGKPATMRWEYPEVRWRNGDPLKETCPEGAIPRDLPLEHITVHGDGNFHVKGRRDGKPVYEHTLRRGEALDRTTPCFLQAIIVSDALEKYQPVEGPFDFAFVRITDAPALSTLTLFSGSAHPLETDMANFLPPGPHTMFNLKSKGGTFRTLSIAKPVSREESGYPPGTVASFRFLISPEEYVIKTFVFD